MNKEISKLTRDFEGLYSGDNWVGAGINDILNTTDFNAAIKKKLPNRNSIFAIVEHSLAWRSFLIKRLSGDRDFDLRANDELDWKKHEQVLEGHWKKLVDDFGRSQVQILDLLCQFDDQLLDETVAQRDYDFRYLINGVIHHDYYHFGQISILR